MAPGTGRRGLVAAFAAAVLGGGAWALAAAPGMPVTAAAATGSRGQLEAAEAAVLAGANAQGVREIQALQAAKSSMATLQAQLQSQTQAAAGYRAAAVAATQRAQQLAAQLQAAQGTPYRGDDGGHRSGGDH